MTNFGILALRNRPISSVARCLMNLILAADRDAFASARSLAPDLVGNLPEAFAIPGDRLGPAMVLPA